MQCATKLFSLRPKSIAKTLLRLGTLEGGLATLSETRRSIIAPKGSFFNDVANHFHDVFGDT